MLKIERDLEDVKDKNAVAIAKHLIKTAQNDKLIEHSLNKENKSILGMLSYVRSEAQKHATNGMAFIDDPTVYSWAQHYYSEDSIDHEPKTKKEEVKVVELPAEDSGAFDI